MKDTNTYLGFIFVLIGLLDIIVVPSFLQRAWKQPPPQSALVLRILRIFGLLMVIIGLLFLWGVIALPEV